MNYELAKQLKDAGFPQDKIGWVYLDIEGQNYPDTAWKKVEYPEIETKEPTLSELIAACGDEFYSLVYTTDKDWGCFSEKDQWNTIATADGKTPEEAAAKLWFALNKKQ
jgi:hypothetical protein